jgi:zinc protease
MQRGLLRLAVAFLVASVLAPAAAAQQRGEGEPLFRTTLPNGLEVIVVENHAVPLATALVAVRSGAFVQDAGEEGLAHLFEHVLFRSYGKDPTAFAREVTSLEGDYNGATNEESVTYFVTVPSEKTKDAIRLLARLVSRARFGKGDLKEERPIVLDELERAASDPERALDRSVAQRLWGDFWHRRDVGGDSASLERITLDRMKEAYARYYVPNNAALIVTGDVRVSEVLEAARRRFRDWDPGPDPFADGVQQPVQLLSGSSAVLMAQQVMDVTMLIQCHGPSLRLDTASTYAADVLLEILNDESSGFQQRLVERGPFQSLTASYLTLSDVGPIEIHGRTTPEQADDALMALMTELDAFALLMDITQEDVAIAKKRREVGRALGLEATAGLAPRLAHWWASGGMDYYLTYHDSLNTRTLDDLRRFAERYVVGKPRIIGILGSPRIVARLAEWLGASVKSSQ